MRVCLVAPQCAPFLNENGVGEEVASFSAMLVQKEDLDVHVIVPMVDSIDSTAHSLARRLNIISVQNKSGEPAKYERYDGRTTSGLDVHLLKCRETADQIVNEDFVKAAAQLVASLDDVALCITWDHVVSHLPKEVSFCSNVHHVSVLADDEISVDSLETLDNVLILGKGTSEILKKKSPKIAQKIQNGSAQVLPLSVPGRPNVTLTDKKSAKASFQAQYGLPVRVDVPLVYVAVNCLEQALLRFLSQDVQLIVNSNVSSFDVSIVDKYPDRVVVIPDEIDDAVPLAAADFCVALNDSVLAVGSMGFGTVPIVMQRSADAIVDLESTLESGSGVVVYGQTEGALFEAFSRGIALYSKRTAFLALSSRLPKFVFSKAKMSSMLAAWLESVIA